MTGKPTVLVLMGGPDAEREVSLCSGREVAEALRQSQRFHVVEEVIDKPTAADLKSLVEKTGGEVSDTFFGVVFPVLHGHWGEGGPLQELLDQLGLPYVGSRPRAARLAMDKLATKTVLSTENIPTPPSRQLMPDDECDLDPPLIIKPVDDGSSVDLRICRSDDEIVAARRELHPKRGRLMAEKYIQGRELTVGIVLGRSLPLIEIIPAPAVKFYDYEAKYTRDDTRYVIDPELPAGIAEQCTEMAMTTFNRLGCRDIARVDIMLDERGPWFLEINTMPGFTTHSLVPMAARKVGLEMPELCAKLVEAAMGRITSPRAELGRAKPQAAGRR